MLRATVNRVFSATGNALNKSVKTSQTRLMSHHSKETDEEFDCRYEAYFNRQDIDGWELRKALNDLNKYDLIPEPKIIIASLKACRRVNDFALTVRWLEVIKIKSEVDKAIYPYILQEIRPTLDELGINTPEELGYDKPELAVPNYD